MPSEVHIITEISYTQDPLLQEDLLVKTQNWFFSKLRLPNIAATYTIETDPVIRTPSPNNSFFNVFSPYVPKHNKSNSLDSKYKLSMYREMKKIETIQLGALDSRQKILQNFVIEKPVNFIENTPKTFNKKIFNKLPSLAGLKNEYTSNFRIREIISRSPGRKIKTPADSSLISYPYLNTNKFPNGGDMLMKFQMAKKVPIKKTQFD